MSKTSVNTTAGLRVHRNQKGVEACSACWIKLVGDRPDTTTFPCLVKGCPYEEKTQKPTVHEPSLSGSSAALCDDLGGYNV